VENITEQGKPAKVLRLGDLLQKYQGYCGF
jgi:hypothetical protein